jgi:hypothetical protein
VNRDERYLMIETNLLVGDPTNPAIAIDGAATFWVRRCPCRIDMPFCSAVVVLRFLGNAYK